MQDSHGIKGNAAFYLSIPPSAFPVVLKQLQRTGLADNVKSGGWRRVVWRSRSATTWSPPGLTTWSTTCSPPRTSSAIDHYLGKETVQNILALRSPTTLRAVWNSNFIDSVQITMAEDVGIGTRAGFYEETGAARDVLQNHLLQLLALTAMEEPVGFDARACAPRSARSSARSSRPRTSRPTPCAAVRPGLAGRRAGQGLPAEEGVDSDSRTETYAAVRLEVETRRWAGRAVLPAHRQAPAAPGHRDRRRVPPAPHLPFAKTDTEELGPTSSSCACSPTRA
jgi:glucose-6-phosphate 1-dehydrogenase